MPYFQIIWSVPVWKFSTPWKSWKLRAGIFTFEKHYISWHFCNHLEPVLEHILTLQVPNQCLIFRPVRQFYLSDMRYVYRSDIGAILFGTDIAAVRHTHTKRLLQCCCRYVLFLWFLFLRPILWLKGEFFMYVITFELFKL